MKVVSFMTAVALLVMTTGCQLQQQQDTTNKDAESNKPNFAPPMHLGAVHQAYPEQKFALLRIIGPMPSGGTVLITHPIDGSNSRIGNLVVSSDFTPRNNIIAADIRSGSVVQGDRVFLYRRISQESEEEKQQQESHPILDEVTDEQVAAVQRETQKPTKKDIPQEPVEEPIVEERAEEPQPTPVPNSAPSVEIPSYLDEIPNDINDWD